MQEKLQRHLSEEILERYALGRLSDTESVEVEEHLLVCEACQDRLQELDDFVATFRRASATLDTAPPSRLEQFVRSLRAFWKGRIPAYAAAALAVVLLVLWLVPRPDSTVANPVQIRLLAVRGGAIEGMAKAPAGAPLSLDVDLTGLPSQSDYPVELVDAAGRAIWSGRVDAAQDRLRLLVRSPQQAGTHWLRIYDNSAQPVMLREFGLKIE